MRLRRTMPNKMFPFSVGSFFGAVLILIIYSLRRFLYHSTYWMNWIRNRERWWMLYAPFFIMAWGFWAIIPSALVFLNLASKETTKTPVMNVFFFYPFIEHTEDAVPTYADKLLSMGGDLMCFLIYGGCIILYIRFIKRMTRSPFKTGASISAKRG